MRMIERRIGLLFAGFLLCFLVDRRPRLLAAGGAGRRSSPPRRSTSRPRSITVPGLRGSLLDRHGNALAASEDAATIYATPYQVKNPPQAAEKLAPILDADRGRGAGEPDRGIGLLLRRPQSRPADRGADRTARAGRDRRAARQPPHLPAGRDGRPGDRRRRLRKPGPDRARGGRGIGARAAPTANGGSSTTRSANRSGWKPCSEAEDGEDIQLTLDPAIEAKTEQVLAEVGETYAPKGATAIVDGPAQLADPGDGQLAAGRPRRPLRRQHRRPAQPGDRLHLRAGLDLQGVHRLGGAGGKTGDAGDDLHPAAAAPRRRPDRSKTPRRGRP